ncbi:MAG: hypothetical protein LUC90_00370 [Lachnospiraceae bacterium]|nr:hypothetical protein [Lachnospiraceae bacterium]
MAVNKWSKYFERHKSQLQAAWFLIFGLAALIVQLGSRVIFDIAFQGMEDTVNIWPFPAQTFGSFLAFLISNTLAKVISYVTNRKKTFAANNNICVSIVIYVVMVAALIVIETIIGTPLQNGLYVLFGGDFLDEAQSTASALSPVMYQVCGVASQLLYGIGDAVIVFFMDKYLIMRRHPDPDKKM